MKQDQCRTRLGLVAAKAASTGQRVLTVQRLQYSSCQQVLKRESPSMNGAFQQVNVVRIARKEKGSRLQIWMNGVKEHSSTLRDCGRDQKIPRRWKCSERREGSRLQLCMRGVGKEHSSTLRGLWRGQKIPRGRKCWQKTEISNETLLRKMLLWEGFRLIRTGTLRAKGEKRITYSGETLGLHRRQISENVE